MIGYKVMRDVTIKFENDDNADHFLKWLSEEGSDDFMSETGSSVHPDTIEIEGRTVMFTHQGNTTSGETKRQLRKKVESLEKDLAVAQEELEKAKSEAPTKNKRGKK